MWLLYGANGTTGRILLRQWAEEGKKRGIPPPILAGRQADVLSALGESYNLSTRVFTLKDPEKQDFSGIQLVVNFAGPYEDTQEPWLALCLERGLDYLDISGEWRSIGALYEQTDRYAAAGRAVIVAAGFDTVAGEAALWAYQQKYPQARRLRLGIYAEGGFSAGTARSALRMLPHGFWAYEKGQFVPLRNSLRVPLPNRQVRHFWPATLAELRTFPAWHEIERLETYVAVPPRYARWTQLLEGITTIAPVARLLDRLIASQRLRLATEMDLSALSFLFVEAEGLPERLWVQTSQAYVFTAKAVLEVVQLYFQQEVQPGVQSAFSRYPQALWKNLPFQMSSQPV